MALTPQILRQLVLEHLKNENSGQLSSVVTGIAHLACKRGLYSYPSNTSTWGLQWDSILVGVDRRRVPDHVQQVMWQMLAQGILVWGLGATANENYPFYRLTEYGVQVVNGVGAQPYDPDGFIAEFQRLVPNADPTILDYLTEAVRAFNASCFKSAAVMVGGASEKAILLLHEQFASRITDPTEKTKFEKDSEGISISRKFNALKKRLDLMTAAKKFKAVPELSDTVLHALPAAFELIRRCRNDAGHPDIPSNTDSDTVFLNLRVFTEHARRVYGLLNYFASNPAEW